MALPPSLTGDIHTWVMGAGTVERAGYTVSNYNQLPEEIETQSTSALKALRGRKSLRGGKKSFQTIQ